MGVSTLVLAMALLLTAACGGSSDTPSDTPPETPPDTPPTTPPTTQTSTPTPTPDPTPESTPWWETDTPTVDTGPPDSQVWDVTVSDGGGEGLHVSFAYELDLAPEANAFVHLGLLPTVNLALLDASGNVIEGTTGELDPTEFGDDTVGGESTFTVPTYQLDEVDAAHICIRVVTGNYDDFVGRSINFCEEVPIEKSP